MAGLLIHIILSNILIFWKCIKTLAGTDTGGEKFRSWNYRPSLINPPIVKNRNQSNLCHHLLGDFAHRIWLQHLLSQPPQNVIGKSYITLAELRCALRSSGRRNCSAFIRGNFRTWICLSSFPQEDSINFITGIKHVAHTDWRPYQKCSDGAAYTGFVYKSHNGMTHQWNSTGYGSPLQIFSD